MQYAPVVIFGYNRPKHIEMTLNSLRNNTHSDKTKLYIMLDGARKIEDVALVEMTRDTVDKFVNINRKSFLDIKVIKSNENRGLANSIISGVSSIINEHGKIIVLEDDLISAPEFIDYMNGALEFYKNKEVWSISGYSFPLPSRLGMKESVYGINRAMSWGWATWKERWNKVDWQVKDYNEFINDSKRVAAFNMTGMDMTYMLQQQMRGEIDSWAIRFCYSQFKEGLYTVCPKYTKIINVGLDNSGIHSETSILNLEKNFFMVNNEVQYVECFPEKRITAELRSFRSKSLLTRICMRVLSIPFLFSIRLKNIWEKLKNKKFVNHNLS